ncbi:MAG: cellulase family glycosylhydrolase [Candidatus Symbiothrix sp.]|jgi:aryl-phospho-beta-D-glucosidase BglC (GH1 family)|nr:cellulase family glycosylhydrolase [Candidatus Symbiothrix sp.]
MSQTDRRQFLKTISAGAAGIALFGATGLGATGQLGTLGGNLAPSAIPTLKNKLPRWRGFNLLNFFKPFLYDGFDPLPFDATEQDLKWIADWGFDFVRIPLSYPYYVNYNSYGKKDITPEQTVSFNEEAIENIENVIYLAHKYKLHVNLNLHRAPGYCINYDFKEPFNLWEDEAAQQAFYTHWDMWAKRFKNVSPERLSFDLLNEPSLKDTSIYRKIVIGCIETIHKYNPDRLIIADGNDSGSVAVPELADLNVSQSCRGYNPGKLTHFRNIWGGYPDDPVLPVWPGEINGRVYDKKMLEDFYRPWIDLVKQGVGVHCGECGCYNKTPHDTFLAWFTDVLDILTPNGIGWSLWNFRGSFGLLDSGRQDVAYENWYGHKLDRKLLNLLQKN